MQGRTQKFVKKLGRENDCLQILRDNRGEGLSLVINFLVLYQVTCLLSLQA